MSCPHADCTVPKPPSEREGDRDSGGRSLRNFNIRNCCFLRILPQSPSAPVSDPGHKHGLLPALAKNMPQAYFLNASRPPGGSLTHRRMFTDILSTQRPKPPVSTVILSGAIQTASQKFPERRNPACFHSFKDFITSTLGFSASFIRSFQQFSTSCGKPCG